MSDSVRCWHCGKMFAPWTNEWFCSDKCRNDYPDDKWPKVKYERSSTEDTSAADDYWWEQRLNDASFWQGQQDRKAGKEVQSTHPAYIQGYNDPEGIGGGTAKETDHEPSEDAGPKAPLVVVRSWLHS